MSSITTNESELMDKKISYVNSTHDKPQLIMNGARFCIKQKNLNSILWRCTKDKCPASVTVSKDDLILRANDKHNHFVDLNEIKLLQLRHKLKEEAQSTSAPIDRIVEAGYSDMITESRIIDSAPKLPTIRTLKNTVNKQRRKIRPKLPKNIVDLPCPLPEQFTVTKHNHNFVLYDGLLGGKRSFIFAAENDIRYLSNRKYWYGDGTFYTSPSLYYQIYSIHAFDEGISTPCIFALLHNKKEETYKDFFTILMKKITELTDSIQLESITIDYELAVKNVFEKYFPNVKVKGCLFHYGQALFRKFTELSLKTPYQNDENLRIWFRSFAAIALLPEEHMTEAFEHSHSIKPELYKTQIDLFFKYHDKTYSFNSSYPPTMYNHYRNFNPRTINYLEGRHNRWKKLSRKAHDDIFSCIDMFKNEQLLAADERERHETGAAPPKRRKSTRISEEALYRLWDKLDKKQIDRDKFLKGAGLRYFQCLKIE